MLTNSVNNIAFQNFTFLKYLRLTEVTMNEINPIFHFGDIINKLTNRIKSKIKFVFVSEVINLDIIFFILLVLIEFIIEAKVGFKKESGDRLSEVEPIF